MTLVKDMVPGLRWGMSESWGKAHIMLGRPVDEFEARLAECGYAPRWFPPNDKVETQEVCSRCLKATEKYA